MEQARLATRVQSTIEAIRMELAEDAYEAFNDLLIIGRIVPKLPAATLLPMLQQLKPLPDVIQTTPQAAISLSPLLPILAAAPVQDTLLDDYLSSSGYSRLPPT